MEIEALLRLVFGFLYSLFALFGAGLPYFALSSAFLLICFLRRVFLTRGAQRDLSCCRLLGGRADFWSSEVLIDEKRWFMANEKRWFLAKMGIYGNLCSLLLFIRCFLEFWAILNICIVKNTKTIDFNKSFVSKLLYTIQNIVIIQPILFNVRNIYEADCFLKIGL